MATKKRASYDEMVNCVKQIMLDEICGGKDSGGIHGAAHRTVVVVAQWAAEAAKEYAKHA